MAKTKISLGRQTDLDANTNKIVNVTDPTNPQDAATKNYVDATLQGLDVKQSVVVATTVPGTLASSFANGQSVDGYTLVTGDRILIKNQSAGAENGIYTVAASGAPTRATDFNTSAKASPGSYAFVEQGTTNGDTGWVLTNNSVILGTTALVFSQFSAALAYSGGTGITIVGTVISVDPSVVVIQSGCITRETPSGAVDGVNTTYGLANTPIAGSEEVYLNGILQEPGGGNDYTISAATITYLTAPSTGDKIRVSYRK